MDETTPISLQNSSHLSSTVEEHPRRPFKQSRWCKVLAAVVFLGLIGLLIFLIWYLVQTSSSRVPEFNVDSVAIIGREPVLFDITLTARNPSDSVDVYHTRGGKVDLAHEGKEMASIEPPNFIIERKETVDIGLYMKSSNPPRQFNSSAQESNDIVVPLSLRATLPMHIRSEGTRRSTTTRKELQVDCDFKVRVANALTIVSQNCSSEYS